MVTAPLRGLWERARPRSPAPRSPRALPPRRRSAAADIAATHVMSSLSRMLDDEAPERRLLALEAIGELDGKRAAALVAELLNDPHPGVRAAAAAAAARSGAAAAVFSLILCLDDGAPEVRREAGRAIELITGRAVALDPAAPDAEREREVEELKGWWKRRRLEQLGGAMARREA